MDQTSLLVIGAGPYGLATAARAKEREIETVIVGRPMSFWTDHMPEGMFLRSGTDWHLDASGVHTFAAFVEERGIAATDIDPVPRSVFLDYVAWFEDQKDLAIREDLVTRLERRDGRFVAHMEDGSAVTAGVRGGSPGLRLLPPVARLGDDAAGERGRPYL